MNKRRGVAEAGLFSFPDAAPFPGSVPDPRPDAAAPRPPTAAAPSAASRATPARATPAQANPSPGGGLPASRSFPPRSPGIGPPTGSPTGPDGHRARLRERLLRGGAEAMPDYEILEMVLFAASPRGDTKPLAKALIARFGSFGAAVSAPEAELRALDGIGDAALATLRLARAAALRLLAAELRDRPLLDRWDRLTDYLTAALGRERVEQFRVLFLDKRDRLLADEVLGRGTVDHAPVYPREVVRRALELSAAAVVLVHNHPGGDPAPSPADLATTAELRAACATLGLSLHDHLIVAGARVRSLRRAGFLE